MEEHPVILFDGVCQFCNGMINFVIKQDKKGHFRFATLQSEAGQRLLQEYGLDQVGFNSFVLIQNGKAYQRSTASLKVMNGLPWYWKEVQVLRIVPAFLRDQIYDWVARNRYKWFGKKEVCMVPTPDLRSRFLN
ncbi:MAG: thiol-disulfide oxidoreductase family protein [Flaviaesturariibacter sp.]|nr:thiol-disulfide oxidoreductase family protein [Flaviaesturariibacter sp.]